MSKERHLTADAAVVGGGLVGLTLAIAFARAGLKTTVIDAEAPAQQLDPKFDGRASALAYASTQMLRALDIWTQLEADAQPINEIRVSDGASLLHLHFDHRELGDGPLGYMVENRHTRLGLHHVAAGTSNLTHIAPMRVEAFMNDGGVARLTLADGREVKAPLICAADGRGSHLRAQAKIKTTAWRYPQTAIVATVKHERDHEGIAHERFLTAGPFAILPLRNNYASLVWTAESDLAPTIMALDHKSFTSEVRRRFGDFLGEVTVLPDRWSYPLGYHLAERFIDERLALVGDAGHGIHPIAGQGLNLGLRDVAALVEVIVDAARLGLDIGDVTVLERYQRWRRGDTLLMGAATDSLNRLFSNNIAPIRLARDLGLAAVNKLPPLKRLFMTHARGSLGQLPKLLRGEGV